MSLDNKGSYFLTPINIDSGSLVNVICRLDQNMTVKVADFGLSRDVYTTDYYTMSHSFPLPVKWLAPEALFDRVFSESTDVVSGYLVNLILYIVEIVQYLSTYYMKMSTLY